MRDQKKSKVGNNVIVTTSWDDGHPVDLKVADILLRFGVKATFYVGNSNYKRQTYLFK